MNDPAHEIDSELCKIRVFFQLADEAYRRFRTKLMGEGCPAAFTPVEWIPISDQ